MSAVPYRVQPYRTPISTIRKFVMSYDTEDTKRLVQNYSQESENYLRQIHVWLGTASAGGAVAMATLAANLPDPAYSFRFLVPTFWFFLIGIVSAGAATFALAMRASSKGDHFASAHNRENINSALRSIPEVIASPKTLADRANAGRDELIKKSKTEHERAERAWVNQRRWGISWVVALAISTLAFVGGFGWPLLQISVFDKEIAYSVNTNKSK